MQNISCSNIPKQINTENLSPDQVAALQECVSFSTMWHSLTGFGGTGKTTLIRYIYSVLIDRGEPVVVSASTNKACAVLTEKIGAQVKTWHSVAGYILRKARDGQLQLFKKRESELVCGGTWIIDEASMISHSELKIILTTAEAKRVRVLFVGDPWQLLPVKGSDSPALTNAHSKSQLIILHRQAEGNSIIALSHAFRRVIDGAPFPDFFSIRGSSNE